MDCENVKTILQSLAACVETPDGARISTTCYYPSFDRVNVYVSRSGDGFRVTDSGEAARLAVRSGWGDEAVDSGLKRASKHYSVEMRDGALVAELYAEEWLDAAILAVANAAAMAARSAKEAKRDEPRVTFGEKIGQVLSDTVPIQHLQKSHQVRGNSGSFWQIDFAVLNLGPPILIKALKPHKTSIALNYSTFSDLKSSGTAKCVCVYERTIPEEGLSLVSQVARVVPLRSLADQTNTILKSSYSR